MIHIMLFLFTAVCLYINAKIQQANNAMITSVPSEEAEEAERIQEPEEITDSINAAIQINKSRIENYLKNFPAEIKWIDIGLFDFTNDGKEEIILSNSYAVSAGGAVISYNYVYDRQGKELFAFLSGSPTSTRIYADYNTMEFYISSFGIHWGAHSDMALYRKIVKHEKWEKDFFIAAWDMRSSLDNDDRYNYIFRVPISHEESLFCNMHEKWLEICHNSQYKQSEKELAVYLHSYENLQEYQIYRQGSIYCLEDKIIVNTGEKQTELTPNAFTFVSDENIICVYEGTITFDASQYPTAGCTTGTNDRYALYQETAEKNILFVNMLFVNQGTGDFYTWKGEDLVPVVEQETGNFYVWKDRELFLIGTQEKEAQYAFKNPTAESGNDLPQEHMTEDELLDKVMDALQQAGYNETNLIYDGTIHYINRTYDMVSAFDDFPDHIVRGQRYYIDKETKALYHIEEEPEFLRTELYYIGTLQ